jgi:hypothetical protein
LTSTAPRPKVVDGRDEQPVYAVQVSFFLQIAQPVF